MPRLVAQGEGFVLVQEDGRHLVSGHLEVEMVPQGADAGTRMGSLQFVVDERIPTDEELERERLRQEATSA